MHDAFVGVVVGIGKKNVPVVRQGVWVDGEAVVLTGDEAAICSVVDARLVVAAVTIPEKQASKQERFKHITLKISYIFYRKFVTSYFYFKTILVNMKNTSN